LYKKSPKSLYNESNEENSTTQEENKEILSKIIEEFWQQAPEKIAFYLS